MFLGGVKMKNCYGEKLITVGGIISSEIARNCDAETVEILAALFSVIGDQLALLLVAN